MIPCLSCGEPTPTTRCPDCTHVQRVTPLASPTALGYDTPWRKLSERARKIQPWCSDCGATTDLTCDHSKEAWKRKAAGKSIRLRDVDVLCRSCNSKRGKARPSTRGDAPTIGGPECWGEARSPLHTPGGYLSAHDHAAGPAAALGLESLVLDADPCVWGEVDAAAPAGDGKHAVGLDLELDVLGVVGRLLVAEVHGECHDRSLP